MYDRTFILKTDAVELPLVVTAVALSDFREQGLNAMNECLTRISDRTASDKLTHKDIVGQMMLDGVADGNTRKVILCALWLAHALPQAEGLVSSDRKFHYVFGETDIQTQPILACA